MKRCRARGPLSGATAGVLGERRCPLGRRLGEWQCSTGSQAVGVR